MSISGFKATNHPQQTAKRGASDDVDDRGTRLETFAPLNDRFRFTLDVAAQAVIGPKGDRPPFGCVLLIWGQG